jgi:FkbM family methyltransferase
MSNNDNGLVRILKSIRAFTLINVPVRLLIRFQTNVQQRIFRFFSIHWPVSGIVKIRLPQGEKVKLYSHTDDYISTQAFWKGYKGYEGPSVELFYYLSKKCSSIFDIGANVGYFTLIGASSNSKASVHTFEPVKRIYERLERNIQINGLLNVTAVSSVVGDSEKPVKFYLPKGKGMVLAGSTKKGWATGAEEIVVPSVTLDSYKKNVGISKIDLIKMDCEFHEIEVLNGMENILKEDKPIILMEVLFPEGEGQKGHFEMVVHLEIEHIMKQNGYYFYLVSRDALIRVDKLEYNPDERNYLFSTGKTEKVYNAYSEMDVLIKTIV